MNIYFGNLSYRIRGKRFAWDFRRVREKLILAKLSRIAKPENQKVLLLWKLPTMQLHKKLLKN